MTFFPQEREIEVLGFSPSNRSEWCPT